MHYKIKKELPFAKVGTIFSTGCWTGGGFGIDLGTTKYKEGGSAHNGVRTFEPFQNALLESLIDNEEWIEKIPTHIGEAITLLKEGKDMNKYLCFNHPLTTQD